MMKVIQICPFFYPVKGGVEEHVLQLSKGLAKRGHIVTIFTSDSSRDSRIKTKVETIEGLQVFRFTTIFSLGDFGKFWPGFITKLMKEDYDIIHVHSYRHLHTILAAFISKLRGIPCIITTHSPFHPLHIRSLFSKLFVVTYDNFFKFFLDKLFSKVITITDTETKYFKHLEREKIVAIPNGINKKIFRKIDSKKYQRLMMKFSISTRDKIILFVGRVHPTKGIDFIINSLRRSKIEQLKVVIVGPIQDKKYFDKLDRMINENDLSTKVIFTDFVTEEEKLILYDISKIFFLPSIYEPFGIVILEAFARGKPVIAVDSDGPRFLIEHGKNGFLVKYEDIDTATRYIKLLLTNKKLYRKISKNNIEKAKQFTWNKIVEKIIKVYEEVLSSNNGLQRRKNTS
jgi:glycosyltransferase involved in cell wall biosynthesis